MNNVSGFGDRGLPKGLRPTGWELLVYRHRLLLLQGDIVRKLAEHHQLLEAEVATHGNVT